MMPVSAAMMLPRRHDGPYQHLPVTSRRLLFERGFLIT